MMVATMGAELERSRSEQLAWKLREDETTRREIAAALPETVSLERFTRAARTALIQTPELANADETTLFQSLVKCAMDGLLPDGREAALVIYGQKVSYVPMIAGVRKAVGEYGWTIHTHAIYANDAFEVDQATDHPTHRVTLGDRGDVVGAWAIARHRDGRHPVIEVMDKAAIEKRRAVSKSKGGPWSQWYAEMAEKSVGHRIAKKLPLDPIDQQRVARIIDAAELDPAAAAAALYGDSARATFAELPSGVQPEPSPAGRLDAPPQPVEANTGSGDDTAPETPSSLSGTDGTVAAATLDDEAVMLAADAAEYVPPAGRYAEGGEEGPLSLAEILDLGDQGRKYLDTCMRKSPNDELRAKATHFARVQMPAEYEAFLASQAKAA